MDARKRGAVRAALATLTACAAALAMLVCAAQAPAAEGTGAIAGTVTSAASNEPLRGIGVTVYEVEGNEFYAGFATTNSSGEYTVKGLRGGAYKVEFSAGFEGGVNFVRQFYREAPTLTSANLVTVVEGSTTHEINADLLTGGKIEGTVTEAEGGAAVGDVNVTVYEVGSQDPVAFATTSAGGQYTVEGLESGSYYLEFSPGFEGSPFGEGFPEEEGPLLPEGVSGRNLIGQFYKGAASRAGATAVPVVREASAEGIDAQLLRGAEIEGTVTDEATHAPISGATVVALGPGGETVAASASTDKNGHYVLAGLESGSYVVAFSAQRYITQYYSGQPSLARANAIAVTRPLVTAAINAALVPKAPANTAAPVVSGTPVVGQTLSCTQGAWTGSPAPSYGYAWLRDGVPIAGAAATTYTVQAADEGNGVTCRVTATNRNGSAAAISNTLIVAVPAPPPPPKLHIATSRAVVRGGALSVQLQCAGPRCQGLLEIVERLTVKRRHHRTRHETVILGEVSYLVPAGQTATVVVHLNSKGKHALAHARHHRLHTEALATVVSGSGVKQALLLSAARHR